jgi:hypothetical protein
MPPAWSRRISSKAKCQVRRIQGFGVLQLLCGALLLGTGTGMPEAAARNQWDINHGASNPPVDPRFLPGGQFSGFVKAPQIQGKPDFWKAQLANRIPAGTVLTAILETDLSSKKNKAGDPFTMTLEDGFTANGQYLIPPKSKIVGCVLNATPAKTLRHGHPGRMQVSLQSLVFPDGSHVPIYAFIDGNPSAKHKAPPKVRNLGQNFADYGQSLSAMAFSFVSGPGFMQNIKNRGLDFVIDSGEAIPIRLSRSLDIPPPRETMVSQPPPGMNTGSDSSRYPYPQTTGMPNGAVPGLVDPQGPVYVPPPPNRTPPAQAPVTAPGAAQSAPEPDPNAIFNQPIKPQSLNDLPDPF